MDDLHININDVRRCGQCAKGTRRWFEGYGFDFKAFLKDGLPASVLLATEDAMAIRVVAQKVKDLSNG